MKLIISSLALANVLEYRAGVSPAAGSPDTTSSAGYTRRMLRDVNEAAHDMMTECRRSTSSMTDSVARTTVAPTSPNNVRALVDTYLLRWPNEPTFS